MIDYSSKISGQTVWKTCFKNHVGKQSEGQVVEFSFITTSSRFDGSIWLNCLIVGIEPTFASDALLLTSKCCLISIILFEKLVRNPICQRSSQRANLEEDNQRGSLGEQPSWHFPHSSQKLVPDLIYSLYCGEYIRCTYPPPSLSQYYLQWRIPGK